MQSQLLLIGRLCTRPPVRVIKSEKNEICITGPRFYFKGSKLERSRVDFLSFLEKNSGPRSERNQELREIEVRAVERHLYIFIKS